MRKRKSALLVAETAGAITNRRDAANAGKHRFYTGRPCMHGHFSERYTTNGGCIACMHPIIAEAAEGEQLFEVRVPLPDIAIRAEDAVKLRGLVKSWTLHILREQGYDIPEVFNVYAR